MRKRIIDVVFTRTPDFTAPDGNNFSIEVTRSYCIRPGGKVYTRKRNYEVNFSQFNRAQNAVGTILCGWIQETVTYGRYLSYDEINRK